MASHDQVCNTTRTDSYFAVDGWVFGRIPSYRGSKGDGRAWGLPAQYYPRATGWERSRSSPRRRGRCGSCARHAADVRLGVLAAGFRGTEEEDIGGGGYAVQVCLVLFLWGAFLHDCVLLTGSFPYRSIDEVDGLVTCCAVEYDGEACLKSMADWVSRIHDRPTFHLGPMIPLKPGTADFSPASLRAEMDMAPDGVGEQVLQYLDYTQQRYGDASVLYISFGTEHWFEAFHVSG